MCSRFGENGTLNIIISRQALLYLRQHRELVSVCRLSAISFPTFLLFHSIKLSNSHSSKTPSRFLPLSVLLHPDALLFSLPCAQSRPHGRVGSEAPLLQWSTARVGPFVISLKNWSSQSVATSSGSAPLPLLLAATVQAWFMFVGAKPGCEQK